MPFRIISPHGVCIPCPSPGCAEGLRYAKAEPSSEMKHQLMYQSVEGRAIKVLSFGEGPRTILLMAGVHGGWRRGMKPSPTGGNWLPNQLSAGIMAAGV